MNYKIFLILVNIISIVKSETNVLTSPIYNCLLDNDDEMSSESEFLSCGAFNIDLKNCTCGKDFVDCSNKGFYTIPTNLTQLPAATKRLFFSGNKIKRLSKLEFNNAIKITVFNLKKNQISIIDADFFASKSLSESLVYLSFCGNSNVTSLNSVNATFTQLETLEINYLQEAFVISDGFFNKERFPKLSKLDLNNANLKFNKPFDRLDILESLRLDSNNLSQLPCDCFSTMKNLKELNLNNNKLNKRNDLSTKCLQQLNLLNTLHLNTNGFSDENLVWLDLPKSLTALDLGDNKLVKFPISTLKLVENLVYLRLKLNTTQLESLADEKSMLLTKMSYLDLTDSNINNLPAGSFAKISTELNDLKLKNCRLQIVHPDAFYGLNNLIHLDLSNNNLRTLFRPLTETEFNYNWLQGDVKLSNNDFECGQIDVEWFIQFYNYKSFDKNLSCVLINGTIVNTYEYLKNHRVDTEHHTSKFNILAIILLILIFLLVATTIVYFVRRKHVKQRQQQYRYRYFTERSQDDGFDTDNVPVYRDCTVSLRIKDTDDVNNLNSNIDSSTAALTEQREIIR